MKTMRAGKIAFRNQFGFCLQPMLDFVTRQRTLVHIREIGFTGDLVWRRGKIRFIPFQFRRPPGSIGWSLILGIFIVLHPVSMTG